MTEMQAIAAIVLSFAVPFAVQLIKTEAMTGKAARILALGCSLLAGVVTGFVELFSQGHDDLDGLGWARAR